MAIGAGQRSEYIRDKLFVTNLTASVGFGMIKSGFAAMLRKLILNRKYILNIRRRRSNSDVHWEGAMCLGEFTSALSRRVFPSAASVEIREKIIPANVPRCKSYLNNEAIEFYYIGCVMG
uniref:Uncharacterized protein n=1 Tax=Glossina pallidipes TaxID=7398 RepID=A0A1A9ZG63_GLOPL